MKKNDITEIRNKTAAELKKLLSENQTEMAKAKLEQVMARQTNRHAVAKLRRKNAIMKTIVREKELMESK